LGGGLATWSSVTQRRSIASVALDIDPVRATCACAPRLYATWMVETNHHEARDMKSPIGAHRRRPRRFPLSAELTEPLLRLVTAQHASKGNHDYVTL
jgi:hypothetical protein